MGENPHACGFVGAVKILAIFRRERTRVRLVLGFVAGIFGEKVLTATLIDCVKKALPDGGRRVGIEARAPGRSSTIPGLLHGHEFTRNVDTQRAIGD